MWARQAPRLGQAVWHSARVRRPVVLLLFAAVFVGEAMWSAIVPLIPEFAHRFSLSPLESGFLLASASVAILVVSIPAGVVGERFGVRRVTLVALAVIALSDAGRASPAPSGSWSRPGSFSASASAPCGRPGSPG